MNPFLRAAFLMLGALFVIAGPAPAQDAPADPLPQTETPPPEATPVAAPAPVPAPMPDMEALVSDAIARVAITTLRDEFDPNQDSFTRTAIALSIARRLRPDDLELIRLERDAWRTAGNEARANALLERIVALDPADTVSLARLLSLRISALQTADDRLAAYDRLLGPQGAAIDPAIRSRLALDSALLLRERGEDRDFVERLTLAATLDVTNKDAAALYASWFLPLADDPQARADLLANIVLADPSDLSAMTNLAQHLFSHGAYRGAQRLFSLAERLMNGSGRELTAEDVFDRLLIDWMVDGDDAVLEPVQAMVDQQQSYINMELRQAEKLNQPPPEKTEAELPASFETLRLGVAFGRKDDEAVRAFAERAAKTVAGQLEQLRDRTGPFEQFTEEQAKNAHRSTLLELTFLRLWGDIQIDEAEAALDELAAPTDENALSADALQRFRGLIALRRGDDERAAALLEPLAASDHTAQVGMALLHERAGREREAIGGFARVALDRPNTVLGAACRRRIETTLGRVLQPTPQAASLDKFGQDFAPWLQNFSESPHNFMSLIVRHEKTRLDLFDRVEVRVSLRNISSYPLGVGTDRPINSRLALTPNMVIEGRPRSPLALPEIVNLDHRLRLMPREELQFTVWADRGSVGIAIEQNADRSISLRWRAFQGVRYDDEERFAVGPMCVSAETDVAFRTNLTEPSSVESLVESIATSIGREFLEDVLLAAGLAVRRIGGVTDAMQVERRVTLGGAIAARNAELDDLTRAYIVCVGFRAGFLFASPAFNEIFADNRDVFVNAAMLLTSYRLAENLGADRLLDHPDPDIAALARLAARHREEMGAVFIQPDERKPEEPEQPEEAPAEPQ